jgi:hypothetical protein
MKCPFSEVLVVIQSKAVSMRNSVDNRFDLVARRLGKGVLVETERVAVDCESAVHWESEGSLYMEAEAVKRLKNIRLTGGICTIYRE